MITSVTIYSLLDLNLSIHPGMISMYRVINTHIGLVIGLS